MIVRYSLSCDFLCEWIKKNGRQAKSSCLYSVWFDAESCRSKLSPCEEEYENCASCSKCTICFGCTCWRQLLLLPKAAVRAVIVSANFLSDHFQNITFLFYCVSVRRRDMGYCWNIELFNT